MNQLIFNSPTSILTWAGAQQGHRLDKDIWYVLKDNLWYYFGYYAAEKEYRLICSADKDLGAEE